MTENQYVCNDKHQFEMKKILAKSIVATITFTVVYVLIDLIFGHLHSLRDYAVQAIIFVVLFSLFGILDEKGWNSWKKIGNLFKRKNTDN